MRRESYSNRFATALEGVDIDNPGTALDRSGHPNPVPRVAGKVRRRHPVEVRRREVPARQHRPHDQDDRARPLHHVAAGAERFLQGRGGDGARLRRRGQRRDQGPVRRRRRHRADRRALHAGAAGEGAPIRPEGVQRRARRREGHHRGAYLLRLRRRHPRAAGGLLVPARVRRLAGAAGVDRDRAVRVSTAPCWRPFRARPSFSACSTSPT